MKKRLISFVVVLALLCSGMHVFAASNPHNSVKSYGDYEYVILANKTIKLTAYFGNAKNLKLPAKIKGKPVSVLGESLIAGDFMYGNHTLEKVTVPDSVIKLEEAVFADCEALKEAHLPDTLKTIPANTFSGCEALKTVTLPAYLKRIGTRAFESCAFKEIKLPDSVEVIDTAAFACTALRSITLPKGLKRLGSDAFVFADLKTVHMQENLKKVGHGAFDVMNGSTLKITVSGDNPYLTVHKNVLYDKSMRTLLYVPNFHRKLVVPAGVTEIADYAASFCDELKTVVLPEGLKRIGASAFYSAERLENIQFPSTLEIIGREAFYDCAYLDAPLPKSLKKIGAYAFFNTNYKKLVIPDHVKTIGRNAFARCPLRKVTLGKGLRSIEKYAFADTGKLRSIKIPKGVKLGKKCFGYWMHVYCDHTNSLFGSTEDYQKFRRTKDFTVYGKNGSSASRYAKANGFKFVKS